MKATWRSPDAFILALVVSVAAVRPAIGSEPFPVRPIRIVVNTAPGGSTDITTRFIALQMSEFLKQNIVVENRGGGDGLIGIRIVKSAATDGYTLLASAGTIAQQMAIRQDAGYDLLKDFTAVGILARAPFLMLVGGGQPDRTVADFIKRAKAAPGKLSYASAGTGTVPHFVGERFLRQAGIHVLHVPYKGNAPAAVDVMSGRVDMIFGGYGGASGQIKAGQFRALGVASVARLPVLPEVPTLTEQGIPFVGYTWFCLVAPASTPQAIVGRLHDALRWAKSSPAIQQRFLHDATEDMDMSAEELKQFLQREVVQSQKLAKELGLANP